jgi:hypothetical protein
MLTFVKNDLDLRVPGVYCIVCEYGKGLHSDGVITDKHIYYVCV